MRRLTPLEVERLQGFPDLWTLYGKAENGDVVEHKDGSRYRQCGNAITVNVGEWILKRIYGTTNSPQ